MLRTLGRTRRSQAATLFPGSEPIPQGSKPRQRLAVPDAVRGLLARDDVVDVADGEPFDVDAPRPSLGEALDTIGRVDDVHVKRPVLGRPRVRERVFQWSEDRVGRKNGVDTARGNDRRRTTGFDDRGWYTRFLGCGRCTFESGGVRPGEGDHEVSRIGTSTRAGKSRSITIICP